VECDPLAHEILQFRAERAAGGDVGARHGIGILDARKHSARMIVEEPLAVAVEVDDGTRGLGGASAAGRDHEEQGERGGAHARSLTLGPAAAGAPSGASC
jgi:hypothetical protein